MKGGAMRNLLGVTLVLISSSVLAETAYVSDRLSAPLRWAQGDDAPVVKQLEAGTPLEVLERAGGFARVKDRQGAEGWLDARQLSGELPARAQLGRANDEVKQLRAQLASADAELKKTRAALAEASAKVQSLETKVAEAPPAAPPVAAPAAPTTSVSNPPDGGTKSGDGTKSWVWVLGAFAMLGIGFAAGILWLRESIRRRSGGMYIKV